MRPRGRPTSPRYIWRRSEGTYRPSIRGRRNTPLACLWQHTWTRPRWMTRSHKRRRRRRRWRWRQRYAVYAHTGRKDTPTSARNTSNSGEGRCTPWSSRRPSTDVALVVSGRHCTEHVAQGGYPTGVGMDCPGPYSKSTTNTQGIGLLEIL